MDFSRSPMQTFQNYYSMIFSMLRNPSNMLASVPIDRTALLAQLRNINTQQLTTAGIVTAEVLGFFTVGEMLGRMKIVGYRTTGKEH